MLYRNSPVGVPTAYKAIALKLASSLYKHKLLFMRLHLAGGVHHAILVQAEHVAGAQAGGIVHTFALVRHRIAHHLPSVLNDKLVGPDGLVGYQAPAMHPAAPRPQVLGALLFQKATDDISAAGASSARLGMIGRCMVGISGSRGHAH